MSKQQWKLLVCSIAALTLLIMALFVTPWFDVDVAGMRVDVDLRTLTICGLAKDCVTVSVSGFKGFYPIAATAAFFIGIPVLVLVVIQGASRIVTGTASTAVSKLGYTIAMIAIIAGVGAGFLFAPDSQGTGDAPLVAVSRTWAPVMFMVGNLLAMFALYLAAAVGLDDDVAEYKPIKLDKHETGRLPVTPLSVNRVPVAPHGSTPVQNEAARRFTPSQQLQRVDDKRYTPGGPRPLDDDGSKRYTPSGSRPLDDDGSKRYTPGGSRPLDEHGRPRDDANRRHTPSQPIARIDDSGRRMTPSQQIARIDDAGRRMTPSQQIARIDDEVGRRMTPSQQITRIDDPARRFTPSQQIRQIDDAGRTKSPTQPPAVARTKSPTQPPTVARTSSPGLRPRSASQQPLQSPGSDSGIEVRIRSGSDPNLGRSHHLGSESDSDAHGRSQRGSDPDTDVHGRSQHGSDLGIESRVRTRAPSEHGADSVDVGSRMQHLPIDTGVDVRIKQRPPSDPSIEVMRVAAKRPSDPSIDARNKSPTQQPFVARTASPGVTEPRSKPPTQQPLVARTASPGSAEPRSKPQTQQPLVTHNSVTDPRSKSPSQPPLAAHTADPRSKSPSQQPLLARTASPGITEPRSKSPSQPPLGIDPVARSRTSSSGPIDLASRLTAAAPQGVLEPLGLAGVALGPPGAPLGMSASPVEVSIRPPLPQPERVPDDQIPVDPAAGLTIRKRTTSAVQMPVPASVLAGNAPVNVEPAPITLSTFPPYIQHTIKYAALTVELSTAGITATREDGLVKTIAWDSIVGVIARRLPPDKPYEGATIVDIVSEAGATVRVVPWTRVRGGLPLADAPVTRAREIVNLVSAQALGAKLDGATKLFADSDGQAAQLPTAATLGTHDERLA